MVPSLTPTVVEVGAGVPLIKLSMVARVSAKPCVQVRRVDLLDWVSEPTRASVFGFGMSGSTSATVIDDDTVVSRMPSLKPARYPSTITVHRRLLPPRAPRCPAGNPAVEQPLRPRRHTGS